MADVLPTVEASPFHLSTSPTAAGPAASTATGLGLTSVAMENGVSSGSGSSRSSGGETVAGAAGVRGAGEEEEEDEEQRRERERDRTDSLAKLEGRAPTTPKMVQAPSTPVSPRLAGSPRGGRRSAESLRAAAPRPRLRGSPRVSGASSRASLATLDSLLTTGESVYEDATEGDTDDGWEDEPNLPRSLPNLTKSPLLPDTPPSEEELASASSDVRKTPRASSPHTPPQASHPEFADGQHLPPSSSSFEEQAILLQRRATLQAEASRRIAIRQSISHNNSPTTPTDSSSTVLSLRRFSTTPRQSAHPTDPHRTSLSSTSSSPLATSPPRQWHPKPLVLTPARTIHTPLTSSSSAASPSRRRESLGVNSSSGSGHSRFHSTLSNLSNWSGGGGANRPVSFRSASPYKAITLGRTGSLAGPSSSSSSSFASRRRSTGYVESAGDLALPRDRHHRKSLSATSFTSAGAGRISWMTPSAPGEPPLRRDRSASEDTGASHLTETGESTTSTVETRYGSEKEGERGTPDSSASGWSDEKEVGEAVEGEKVEGKRGSPSLDDKEWEREYFRRTGPASASGTPLESVQEGESGTGSDTPATMVQARFSPRPLQLEEEAAGMDTEAKERVEEATSGALAETSQAPVLAQVGEKEENSSELAPPVPYLPTETPASPPVPPKEPGLTSPRQPQLGSPRQSAPSSPGNSTVAPVSPTTPYRRRPSARYDELWNGEPSFDSAASDSEVSLSLSTPPRNTSFEASASRPTSQLNPAHSGETNPASPARSIASSTDATKSNAPRKGKPIVIKSVTARSSAANARRSQRLSQVEPPLLDGASGTPNRLSSRFEGGPAHNRLSARLGENGGASQRLSTRLSKRLSIAPSSPKQPSSPPTATTSPTAASTSPRSPPSGTRSPPQLRKSPPQEEASQLGNVVATGLAIWPPPAETKTVTLAPPLAYHTDSELSSASIGDATDDEDIPPTSPQRAAERERARIGHSTSPRSSGYSFPSSTRRRTPFEPRDPRAKRDDFDTGDSFLEVLLSTEPPPSMNLNRRHYLDEDDRSYASNSTGTTLQAPFQSKQGGGITKKLFGGLKNKSPTGSSSDDRSKKPISIAPGGSAHRRRSGSNKPRPVVSAPLELQAASHAMLAGQRSLSGSSQSSQGSQQYWGSVQGSPNQPQSSIALGAALASRYTSAATAAGAGGNDDAAEELASMYGDGFDGRPSMDSVYRPAPKAYALPPGLLSAGDAPPLPPHRPIRPSASPSPSQTSQRSSVGLAPSPAQSFTSVLNSPFQMRPRQGSKDSSTAGSFISASAGSATSPFYPRKGSTGSATQTGTGFDLAALPVMSTREVLREQVVQR